MQPMVRQVKTTVPVDEYDVAPRISNSASMRRCRALITSPHPLATVGSSVRFWLRLGVEPLTGKVKLAEDPDWPVGLG